MACAQRLGSGVRRYSSAYVRDEDYAREQKHGLWSGAFIAPWDWRHRGPQTMILGAVDVPTDAQRQLISPAFAAAPPASNCVIKGNLSRREQCIYHMPGGQFYDRLNMESTRPAAGFAAKQRRRRLAVEDPGSRVRGARRG